jgi:undecaprenyl-phosphate 4-deoxy-4-formamido-L-arabinose transferase
MLRGYARPVVDQIVAQRDGRTFLPALGYLLSERPCEIEVSHEARSAGRSRYSLIRLLRLHLDLTTGFSVAPLRMLFGAGLVAGAAGVALAGYIFVMRVLHGDTWAAQGVFTLFAVLFLFIGAQFVALGLIGEYVGRVLQTVRRRPPYVVLSRPAERRR